MCRIRTLILVLVLASLSAAAFPAGNDDAELLKVRKSVWVLWLANESVRNVLNLLVGKTPRHNLLSVRVVLQRSDYVVQEPFAVR